MHRQRLIYIDQLKGFAILLVVAGHILEFCLYKDKISFLHDIIYSFHMSLFAFLSGLVFSSLSDYKKAGQKFLRQSYRLLVPFLSMGLIYAYTIRKEDFFQHPYKLGLWYLFFLWQCYVATHIYNIIILPFAQKNKKVNIGIDLLWMVFICGIAKIVLKFSSLEVNSILGTIHFIRLYPFFFIGCVLKRYSFTPPRLAKRRLDC